MIAINSKRFFDCLTTCLSPSFSNKGSHLVSNPRRYSWNSPFSKEIQMLRCIVFFFSTIFSSRVSFYDLHFRQLGQTISPIITKIHDFDINCWRDRIIAILQGNTIILILFITLANKIFRQSYIYYKEIP